MKRYSPQALQIEFPSASLRQRGVSMVPQFAHGKRAAGLPLLEKSNSSVASLSFADGSESYVVNSLCNRCTLSECGSDGEVGKAVSCLM